MHNTTLSEIATGLSTAVTKDGQTTITANLPMAGYRHTGVGNPTARTHYATAAGCQDGTYAYLTSPAGTNTITATAALSMSAYAAGQMFWLLPANTNTGATTINVNSIGAKDIYYQGAACGGGELFANVPALLLYDGTRFHVISAQNVVGLRTRGYLGSSQTLASASTYYQVAFETEVTDNYSEFNTGTYRFTPAYAMTVRVSATAYFQLGADGDWAEIALYTGGSRKRTVRSSVADTAAALVSVQVNELLDVTTSDYIEFFVQYSSATANRSILGTGLSGERTFFAIEGLR